MGFVWLHIPGGAISGAVISVALLSLTGHAHGLGPVLRVTGLAMVGVAVGAIVGPDTFRNMMAYPFSIAAMAVCVVTMTAVATCVWMYLLKWPFSSALLASVPGSMSYIVAVSITMGKDAARIAVVQMSRVVFLVTLLPLIVAWDMRGRVIDIPVAHYDPLQVTLAVLALGIAGGWVLEKLGSTGGFLLGGMIVSGIAHYMGWAPGRSPDWVMNAGQIIVGAWTGSRFSDFDWKLFWRIAYGTALAVGSTMAISIGFAAFMSWLLNVPFGAALIGYSPGGLEAMVVLALALNVDPIFVAAHHFARYFIINASLPFIIPRLLKREEAAKIKSTETPGG
jgi:membrane AbrB-like protein